MINIHIRSRKSPRKKWFDYTIPLWYFVMICTKNRRQYFGEIVNGGMMLNEIGKVCSEYLKEIENLRKNVHINEYVIMPNHVHMIVILGKWNADRNDKNIINHRRGVSIIRPEYWIWNYNTVMARDDFLNRPYGWPTVWNIIKLFEWNITKYTKKTYNTIHMAI